jgi:hypothetical protein
MENHAIHILNDHELEFELGPEKKKIERKADGV